MVKFSLLVSSSSYSVLWLCLDAKQEHPLGWTPIGPLDMGAPEAIFKQPSPLSYRSSQTRERQE
jgi:hypothetical protein